MMKKNIFIIIAISILFASCSDDNNNNNNTEINDGVVNFSSGVNTRVSGDEGNTWDAGDPIGIYMVKTGGTDIAETANNRLYTAIKSGTVTSFTSTIPIYYPVDITEKVDFIAYHPHRSAEETNYIYNVNTTAQTNQSAIDLMRATANNSNSGYDKLQGMTPINLIFDHKLTKVILKIIPGDGLSLENLEPMTVTIKGLNTTTTYDIINDALSASADPAPIETYVATPGVQYEAIVVPQTFSANAVTVEFALKNENNEVFVYEVPTTTFNSAQKHIFSVTVQRTRVEVTGEIASWLSVGEVSGTAI